MLDSGSGRRRPVARIAASSRRWEAASRELAALGGGQPRFQLGLRGCRGLDWLAGLDLLDQVGVVGWEVGAEEVLRQCAQVGGREAARPVCACR